MSSLANAAASLLGGTSQAGRLLSLSTPLGPNVLLLERFAGSEGISQLFRFQLSMVATAFAPVPFDQVLGQRATVRLNLPDGSQRYWNGIMSWIGRGGPVVERGDRSGSFVRYHGALVPHLWLLRRRVQSRAFTRMKVPEIVQAVLNGLPGLKYQMQVKTESYPTREYVVQYAESDFAFISRLMEDEGIYYYFTHAADGHQLVVCDSAEKHPDIAAPSNIPFDPLRHDRHAPQLQRFQCSQQLQSSKYTLWDYSFELADSNLGASKLLADSVQVGGTTYPLRIDRVGDLEDYEYPGNYAHHFDGIRPDGSPQPDQLQAVHDDNRRVANLRMQERAARAMWAKGKSNCGQFLPGHKFTIDSRWTSAGPYLLTEVRHVASQVGAWRSHAGRVRYSNRFRCIPQAIQYRPRRQTRKPRITSTQTGVVVGPTGQDVFTDKYGRVQVQFHWDRSGVTHIKGQDGHEVLSLNYWPGQSAALPTTCWVRVSQNWAGRGWGQIVVPRIGQEVIVGFLEGDPDQPIILGSVYNSVNLPPFSLPDHALASGVKTQTAGGGADHYNGLAFNDTSGQENVQLQAQRNLILNAKQHLVTNIGGNYYENIVGTRLKYTGQPPSLGDAGGDPTGKSTSSPSSPPPSDPWNWKVGDVSATIGKTLSMVFGEDTKAVAGLSASLTLGNKFDLLINPLIIASAVPGFAAVSAVLSPLLGMFAGRNEFILGPKSEFAYWPKTTVLMNSKNDYAPEAGQHTILKRFIEVSALLMTAEWLVIGGAGQHFAKGWDDPGTKGLAITGGSVGVLAVVVFGAVQALLCKAKALQDAATAAKNATAAQNAANATAAAAAGASAAAANFAGSVGIPNLVAAPGPAAQYKMDSYSGPMLANYANYQLVGQNSILIVSGTGTALVPLPPVSKNTISMDPLLGLTLSNGNPVAQPKITLSSTGAITISVTGSEIKLDPLTGISLTYGVGPAAKTIKLGPTGISLEVAPGPMGGSVKLQNTGTTIGGMVVTIQPQTGYLLKTKNLVENISALALSKGAVRQIMG